MLRTTGPNFLAIHDVLVTITNGASSEVCQVASAIWFAEQLTPEIFTRQQPQDVLLLLFVGSCEHNCWPSPTDPNGVGRTANTSFAQLVIDDDLMNWVGI